MKVAAKIIGMALPASLILAAGCVRPSPARLPGLSVQKGVLVMHGKPYRGIGANDPMEAIAILQGFARKANKPLFIGGFGVSHSKDPVRDRAQFQEILQAIEKDEVPLSAFWVFDQPDQEQDWNVTFDNDRAL